MEYQNRAEGVLSRYSIKPETLVYFLFGITITLGVIITGILPVNMALAIPALLVLPLVSKSPLKVLLILVFFTPFSGTSLFRTRLGLPGTEPFYLLTYFAVTVAILNYKQSVKMTRFSLLFTILYLTIFTISIIHSLFNSMEVINFRLTSVGRNPFSTFEYILQYFVRQVIYFIPFVLILKFVKRSDHLEFLVNSIVFVIVILSVWIIYLQVFKIEVESVAEATEAIGSNVGLHRNALADFFIVGVPIVLGKYFLKRNIWNILIICLSVVATGFIFSRTAYVALVLAFIIYLLISKRAKFLPILLAIAIGLSFLIPSIILERASRGLGSGDISEVTGRPDNIWMPLIEEYTQDTNKLIFGGGRYALVSTKAVEMGVAPNTMMHPHNLYLEQILDVGILGFAIMMLLFLILFRKAYKNLKNVQNYRIKEYLYAVIVSMISFFIAGMTGRSLFPGLKNGYFWIVVGMAFALIRLVQESKENKQPEFQSSKP